MKSATYTLLSHVWENGKKDTWSRINHAMREALKLSIGSGLGFVAEDFDSFSKFRPGYWMGESWEWIYRDAIINGNESCIQAYEEWTGRKPFMANTVGSDHLDSFYLHRHSIDRERERLAVDLHFPYEGRRWYVSGFDDEAGIIRLAAYPGHHKRGKPDKLMKLTNAELRAICPAPKKTKKTSAA